MSTDTIRQVRIDEQGRLCLYPSRETFPLIYREAAEVHWDASGRFLYSPKPRAWSYLDWYKQIIRIAEEQGCLLKLTTDTIWTDIATELKDKLQSA